MISKREGLKLAAALLLATVGTAATHAPVSAQTNITIALPAPSLLFAPVYIAQEQGKFRENGLDAKIIYASGPAVVPAVLGRSAEFAVIAGGIHLAAAVRNQKLVAIANTQDHFTTDIVVRRPVAEKIGQTSFPDAVAKVRALKGLTIGVDAINGLPHSFLRFLAKKAGMNPETDFTITALQPQAMVAAMKSGTIDAMAFSPPFSLTAVSDGGVLWVTGPEVDMPELRSHPYNVVLTRPDYCQSNAAICRAVVTSLKQAVALMKTDPSASVASLAKTFDKMDPQILKQSYEIFAKYAQSDIALSEQMYKNVAAYNKVSGIIPEDAKLPPVAEMYDLTFTR